MEQKVSGITLKLQAQIESFTMTDRTWSTHQSLNSARETLQKVLKRHQEKMEGYAEFDKEMWKSWLKRKVIDKKWGKRRCFNEIQEYFELEETEEKWLKKWIEIYRTMRLEEVDQEKAKRWVEHELDTSQTKLTAGGQ